MDLSPGLVVAGHRLLRRLGQGAHGAVYLAEDGAGMAVALKIVPLHSSAAAAREAFLQCAEAARGLRHPDIVMLRAAGIEGRLGWLAMEAVPGVDLGRYAAPRRLLPEAVVLRAGERVALALAHAHGRGVVHRDLKPANVLVDWPTRTLKLADFGLARVANAVQTGTGIVPGTPAYMAPELLAGGLPTPRSDFYALGVMLFQLLSGCLPHEAVSMGDLLRIVAREPAPDLRALRPGIPPAAAGFVARLLAKRAADRPVDGAAVAADLRAAASGFGPSH